MYKNSVLLRGIVSLFLCTSLFGASYALTFADTQFLDSGWSGTKVVDTTPGSSATFAAFHTPTGGNLNDYRHTNHSYASGGLVVYHENLLANCTVSPSNPITTIDYSFDAKVFNVGASGAVAYGLALRQSSNIYIHYNLVFPGPWSTFSFTGLTASSFTEVNGGGNPNFSLTGPVELGYFTSNGTSGGATFTESGIDNWRVTVNGVVPEPSSSLALAGFTGALVLRRRRR